MFNRESSNLYNRFKRDVFMSKLIDFLCKMAKTVQKME